MNGGVSEFLIIEISFYLKLWIKCFRLRDFVCKQGDQIYRGAFLCDIDVLSGVPIQISSLYFTVDCLVLFRSFNNQNV